MKDFFMFYYFVFEKLLKRKRLRNVVLCILSRVYTFARESKRPNNEFRLVISAHNKRV